MKTDQKYLKLADKVLTLGEPTDDRTGTGTISLPHQRLQFNLADEFPIIQSKKVSFHSIMHELIWMLKGDKDIDYLRKNKVTIWDEWVDEYGGVGKIYGHNWRNFGNTCVDQIANLVEDLRNNPKSRRMIVTSWNPTELRYDFVALPPCHCFFQVTTHGNKINLMLHQRSVDMFLGLPYNITSYALLMHILANETDMEVGLLTMNFGDCHIYNNHVEQMKLQVSRLNDTPENITSILIDPFSSVDDIEGDDITLQDYNHLPAIKGDVSV